MNEPIQQGDRPAPPPCPPHLGRLSRCLLIFFLLGLLALCGWLLLPVVVAEYHLHTAVTAVARCHNLAAQQHLQICLHLRPDSPRANLLAARVAWRVGAFEVAERCLDRYQEVRGDDDALVLERVLLRAASGEVDEVAVFCKAQVEQESASAALVREAVASGLLQVYRLHEAEGILRDWRKRDPDNTQALLLEGMLHDLRLQTNEALDCYRRVVELDPEHDEARLRLATVLVQNSEGEEGLPHAEYLARRLPDNPRVILRLAQCRALLGRQDESREALDALLRKEPHYAPALAERGKLALQQSDPLAAETLLREAVAREPSALDARYLLAQALRRNGRSEEAKAESNTLARLEEDAARIHKIATIQMQQKPNDPGMCQEIGAISLRAGAVKEGLRWLYKALAIDPKHTQAHKTLADWYERTGNSFLAARHRRLAGGSGP